MAVTVVWREYNPTTGKLIGNVNSFSFGHVSIGEFSPVRVFDLSVPDASLVSNVEIEITASPQIVVNQSPVDIRADGTAGNGNFGIEMSDTFLSRSTLTRFFAGLDQPVTVQTRATNVSNYLYLNAKMNMSAPGTGSVTYKVSFDYS